MKHFGQIALLLTAALLVTAATGFPLRSRPFLTVTVERSASPYRWQIEHIPPDESLQLLLATGGTTEELAMLAGSERCEITLHCDPEPAVAIRTNDTEHFIRLPADFYRTGDETSRNIALGAGQPTGKLALFKLEGAVPKQLILRRLQATGGAK